MATFFLRIRSRFSYKLNKISWELPFLVGLRRPAGLRRPVGLRRPAGLRRRPAGRSQAAGMSAQVCHNKNVFDTPF